MRKYAQHLWFAGWLLAWLLPLFGINVVAAVRLLFAASGVVVGLYLFFNGFQLLNRKRWIQDTPITKIGAAAIGPVKVAGRAAGPYTLISPLAGVDCLFYRAVAWDGRNAQDDTQPEARASETLCTPLFVEDETGRLMVDPQNATLELPVSYDGSTSGDSNTENSRRFLQRHGLSTLGDTNVTEYAIQPGDPLVVLGMLKDFEERSHTGGYLSREAASLQRYEQIEPLGISSVDLPASTANMDASFELSPRCVLAAGDRSQPLVLSHQTPQRMIESLNRRSTFRIWGGPVLAVSSLVLFLRWLNAW